MPPSYIRVRAVVWAYCHGQTDTQTDRQTHRRAWPQYILRCLRLMQNVATTTTTSGQHKHKFLCHPLHPCEFIVSNAAVWVRAAATSRLHLYSKRQLHVIRKQRINVELYAEQWQCRIHCPKTRHRVVVLLNVTIDIWAQHGVVLHTNSKLLIVSPLQHSHMTRSFISRNDNITPWHTTTPTPWCVYFIYVPWRYVEK